MTRGPTRDEVLGWLALTGRSQSEAVDHFWPNVADDERRRVGDRVRQWVKRARDAGLGGVAPGLAGPPAAAANHQAPPAHNRENDDERDERIGLTRLDFLERQLRDNLRALDRAIEIGRLNLWSQIDRRVSDVFEKLETARERERKIVRLERTPAAICAELDRRADAIALRAEMQRRKAERAGGDEDGG